MLTLSAFHTTMPFLPTVLPSLPVAPKLCWVGSALQVPGEPAWVPSTMTVDLFIPRRWIPDVVINTPPAFPWAGSVDAVAVSADS